MSRKRGKKRGGKRERKKRKLACLALPEDICDADTSLENSRNCVRECCLVVPEDVDDTSDEEEEDCASTIPNPIPNPPCQDEGIPVAPLTCPASSTVPPVPYPAAGNPDQATPSYYHFITRFASEWNTQFPQCQIMLANNSPVNPTASNVPASYAGSSSTINTIIEPSSSKTSSDVQTSSDSSVNMNNQVSNPPKTATTDTETSGLVISQIINVAASNTCGTTKEIPEETVSEENQIPSIATEITPTIKSQTSITHSTVSEIHQIDNDEPNNISGTASGTAMEIPEETRSADTQITCDLSVEAAIEIAPSEHSTENQKDPEANDSLLDYLLTFNQSDENLSSSCDSAYHSGESSKSPTENDSKSVCADEPAPANVDVIVATNNIPGTAKEIPEETTSAETQITCDLSVEATNEVTPIEHSTENQKEPDGDDCLLTLNQSDKNFSSSRDSAFHSGESSPTENDPKNICTDEQAAANGDKNIACNFTRNIIPYDDITYDEITYDDIIEVPDDTIISIEDSEEDSFENESTVYQTSKKKNDDSERNLNTFRSAKLFSKAIKDLGSNKTNVKSVGITEQVSKRGNKNYLAIDNCHVLLHLTESVGFYGNLSIKLLAGSASVAGYTLNVGESVTAHTPVGHSAISIVPHTSGSLQKWKESIKELFFEADLKEIEKNLLPSHAILLLKRMLSKRIEFVERHMDYSIFPIPRETITVAERILQCCMSRRYNIRHDPNWDSIKMRKNSRMIVVGRKNVGKSTLLRYLVNKNVKKFGKILLIDLDIGQPETFVPQTVSATLLDGPLIGMGCFAERYPVKSYLFGDLDVTNAPQKYIECVAKLILELKEMYPEHKTKIPWIINTIGYSRGIGCEILVAILRIIAPTDVIQITQNYSTEICFSPSLVRRWMWEIINIDRLPKIWEWDFNILTLRSMVDNDLGRNESDTMPQLPKSREIYLLAHLADILEDHEQFLSQSKPICAPLERIRFFDFMDEDIMDWEYTNDIFNANLVYLCKANDPLECLGIGIVRGIDEVKQKLYLLPSRRKNLKEVDSLAVCVTSIPKNLMLLQHDVKGELPYVYFTYEPRENEKERQECYKQRTDPDSKFLRKLEASYPSF